MAVRYRAAAWYESLGRMEPLSDDSSRLGDRIDAIVADEGLTGVVRVDLHGGVAYQRAYGMAHRGLGVPNTIDTQFAIASGSKTFTALAVMSLVEHGDLALDTTARSVLGDDLPLIDDRVTVEQLLAHRSGIGDYLDEDEVHDWNDYLMTVPVQELATTEQFLRVLDGFPMKHEPGERFVYCNGGFVVLALIAERASGVPYHDLVEQRVCAPAGMIDTAFLRSDELPGRAALGYLEDEGLRTNVFHLPVRGNGDGGATPPRPTATRCGTRSSPDGSCRPRRSPRWCARAATYPRTRCDTDSASGSTSRPVLSRCTASMPAADSCRPMIPVGGSPTPCSATRGVGRGRSVSASTSWSQHRRDHRPRDGGRFRAGIRM